MDGIKKITKKVDTYQRKHTVTAFSVAVIKRYGDDKVGKQAALITYYAFLSLFPLLLIFMTGLGMLAGSNPELQQRISDEVFRYFPALSGDLRDNVDTIKGSGFGLVLQILVLLYGARGLAAMLQEAFNNVWHIEKKHRPGFVGDNLRSFGMMASVAAGIILGTVISYSLGNILNLGIVGSVFLTLLNLVFTLGLFLIVFRLGTSNRIALKTLIPGAIIAGIGVLIVQHFGGYIMKQQLPKLEGTYGSFAITLGMLFWIYLQAQIILYALVITAVKAQKDWPKRLFPK